MSLPRRSSSRSSSRPPHHANNYGTSFINPWLSAGAPTWSEMLKASFFPFGWYEDTLSHHKKARDIKVVRPDWGGAALKERGLDKSDSIIGTWLGHASSLVEISPHDDRTQKSVWLLFDPIFSLRAGPTQYSGVARMKNSPCQVDDLPGCDAVLISHNHYDHLDLSSIKAISKRFPKARYFVPLGMRRWMLATGLPDHLISEMDWWQNREYSFSDLSQIENLAARGQGTDQDTLKFSCVPAQHNSGRSPLDQGGTLWCGWVVERFIRSRTGTGESKGKRKGAIYHAGDTGYRRIAKSEVVCPVFEEIGEMFGPIDLSFIPIWRGGSLGFISTIGLRLSHHDIPSAFHASPADAIDIHLDVQSRNTIGVHFGTFIGSEKESYEAVIEFGQACDDHAVGNFKDEPQIKNGRADTLDIGESLAVSVVN